MPVNKKHVILLILTGLVLTAACLLSAKKIGRLLFPSGSELYSMLPAEQPDTMEYVPGYPYRPLGVEEQFKIFPSPQFKPDYKLLPNFLWMDPIYFSWHGQAGITSPEAVQASVKLQSDLAAHWNYYFLISSNTTLYNRYQTPGTFEYEWVNTANRHPEWKTAAICFWAQLRPQHLKENACDSRRAFITRKDLPDTMYVMEDVNGRIYKRWNPANSVADLQCDIRTQQFYFRQLQQYLRRPLNIINENGEVFHHFQDEQMAENIRVKKDMKQRGIKDSEEYQALRRMESELAYRDSILGIKGLEQTLYTVYSIDGQNKFRHRYDIMRQVPTKIRGMNYATPDFYPRWPDNWKKWKGPWHGIDWIVKCRNTELQQGDRLFSPFVAAGWDNDETKNIRPAQWLGLMKILGVMGAEFFYTGFFNLKKPYADPRGYAWQAVIPVYAQAALSQAEDILLQGELLNSPDYLIPSGHENIITVARKQSGREAYLVATAIMVNSNEKTDRAEPLYIDIEINGMKLHLLSRRQGALYRIEKSEAGIRIRQLDKWHEDTHPARWSRDLSLSADLWEQQTGETEEEKNGEVVIKLNPGQHIRKDILLNAKDRFVRCEIKIKNSTPAQLDFIVNGKVFPIESKGGRATLKTDILTAEGKNTFELHAKKGMATISEIKLIHE